MTFLVMMTKASILVTTKLLHHLSPKFILLQHRFSQSIQKYMIRENRNENELNRLKSKFFDSVSNAHLQLRQKSTSFCFKRE